MRFIYADYNMWTNSIDIMTFDNYILRIDCNKAEEGLELTQYSQFALSLLALDDPLEYAALALAKKLQEWADEEEAKNG